MALRDSSACWAEWGRYQEDDPNEACCWYRELRVERQISSPYGWYTTHIYRKTLPTGAGTYWTPMVQADQGSNDRTRICYKFLGDPDSNSTCSGWYY
jgi:hypothetical protein